MDRARAAEAVDTAREALAGAGESEQLRIAADGDGTRLLDEPRTYCPGRLPCLGMTGVRIAVPVRIVAAERPERIGELVGEITATRCSVCQAVKPDGRETA